MGPQAIENSSRGPRIFKSRLWIGQTINLNEKVTKSGPRLVDFTLDDLWALMVREYEGLTNGLGQAETASLLIDLQGVRVCM